MDGFIYNQRDIPKQQWRYGLRSSAATGCGWIATYNALQLLGHPAEPEALIRDYARQVPILNGNTGTVLFGPAMWFKKRGFPVKTVASRAQFDAAAKEADVCILFYRWIKKYRYGAHFVALHYTDDGFIGYNTFRSSTGPDRYGPSLDAFLKRQGYFGAVLFTIKNKKGTLV